MIDGPHFALQSFMFVGEVQVDVFVQLTTSPGGGWWVLDFTRLMLISTQVEVVVEVGVELGKMSKIDPKMYNLV